MRRTGDQMKEPDNHAIQLFEDQKIRVAWDAEREEWYFSVQDVVAVLSESTDSKQYIKKMRARDPQLSANWGTICTPPEKISFVNYIMYAFVLQSLNHKIIRVISLMLLIDPMQH